MPSRRQALLGSYDLIVRNQLTVGAMFGLETQIHSRCQVTGTRVSIRQRGTQILEMRPSDVRVGVRWQRLVDCCAHVMSRQMVFLKDEATAYYWLNADPVSKELFTAPEAAAFGEAFFKPLLED